MWGRGYSKITYTFFLQHSETWTVQFVAEGRRSQLVTDNGLLCFLTSHKPVHKAMLFITLRLKTHNTCSSIKVNSFLKVHMRIKTMNFRIMHTSDMSHETKHTYIVIITHTHRGHIHTRMHTHTRPCEHMRTDLLWMIQVGNMQTFEQSYIQAKENKPFLLLWLTNYCMTNRIPCPLFFHIKV